VDRVSDQHGPVRAFTPAGGLSALPARLVLPHEPPELGDDNQPPDLEHLQREAFSPIAPAVGETSPISPTISPISPHKTVFIGDSAEGMLRVRVRVRASPNPSP